MYSIGRFFISFLRVNNPIFLGLKQAQLLALGVVIVLGPSSSQVGGRRRRRCHRRNRAREHGVRAASLIATPAKPTAAASASQPRPTRCHGCQASPAQQNSAQPRRSKGTKTLTRFQTWPRKAADLGHATRARTPSGLGRGTLLPVLGAGRRPRSASPTPRTPYCSNKSVDR